MDKLIIFALIMLPAIISCRTAVEYKRPDEFPVISYNNLKTEEFNVKISSAAANGEEWVYHPLMVIQEYRSITDTRFTSIVMEHDRGEAPLNSRITVVEEGYLDDSVRGQWFKFYLERESPEAPWKVNEIRQAYLCGRMGSEEEFSKELCP